MCNSLEGSINSVWHREVEEEEVVVEAVVVEVKPKLPRPSQNPRRKKPRLQLTCSVVVMVEEETTKSNIKRCKALCYNHCPQIH